MARLTPEQVRWLAANADRPRTELAAELGVSTRTVAHYRALMRRGELRACESSVPPLTLRERALLRAFVRALRCAVRHAGPDDLSQVVDATIEAFHAGVVGLEEFLTPDEARLVNTRR